MAGRCVYETQPVWNLLTYALMDRCLAVQSATQHSQGLSVPSWDGGCVGIHLTLTTMCTTTHLSTHWDRPTGAQEGPVAGGRGGGCLRITAELALVHRARPQDWPLTLSSHICPPPYLVLCSHAYNTPEWANSSSRAVRRGCCSGCRVSSSVWESD